MPAVTTYPAAKSKGLMADPFLQESQKSHPDSENADFESDVKAIQEPDHRHTGQSQEETCTITTGYTYLCTKFLPPVVDR